MSFLSLFFGLEVLSLSSEPIVKKVELIGKGLNTERWIFDVRIEYVTKYLSDIHTILSNWFGIHGLFNTELPRIIFSCFCFPALGSDCVRKVLRKCVIMKTGIFISWLRNFTDTQINDKGSN